MKLLTLAQREYLRAWPAHTTRTTRQLKEALGEDPERFLYRIRPSWGRRGWAELPFVRSGNQWRRTRKAVLPPRDPATIRRGHRPSKDHWPWGVAEHRAILQGSPHRAPRLIARKLHVPEPSDHKPLTGLGGLAGTRRLVDRILAGDRPPAIQSLGWWSHSRDSWYLQGGYFTRHPSNRAIQALLSPIGLRMIFLELLVEPRWTKRGKMRLRPLDPVAAFEEWKELEKILPPPPKLTMTTRKAHHRAQRRHRVVSILAYRTWMKERHDKYANQTVAAQSGAP